MIPQIGMSHLTRVASRCLLAGLTLCTVGCASDHQATLGLWYADSKFAFAPDSETTSGSALTPAELDTIKRISHVELERAFSGLDVTVVDGSQAFWRVKVLERLPTAGQSFTFGALGGIGYVGFDVLADSAIQYAPVGASRQDVVVGIGRGIGRAAAHEFAHQVLGQAMRDDVEDRNSYEYHASDRASQYYGELHWRKAWPLLQQRMSD